MLVLDAQQINSVVSMQGLISCLEEAFKASWVVAPRQIVEVPGGARGRLFVSMPAFDGRGGGAVKLATVFPENQSNGLPRIQALILVFTASGKPLAVLDGTVVTQLRTGAASGLASKYLSRADSTHLVVIGSGALAPSLVRAHCAVRPISQISVWGRRSAHAEKTVTAIRSLVEGAQVGVAKSLEAAVATADIVCCATSSPTPVLSGKWLRPGTFVDLVGSFSPETREADDEVMRCARIFVDTRDGALSEAGDILDPLARGVIQEEKIEGDLADLVRGVAKGRTLSREITLFKSVGSAIEDAAAAQMILASWSALGSQCPGNTIVSE